MNTITNKAQQFSNAFASHTRQDGAEINILDDTKKRQWMTDIIFAVCQALNTDLDSAYKYVPRVVAFIAGLEPDNPNDAEEIRDHQFELEPDIYTNQLTHWLASNINHVAYLNQALEWESEDGFNLLRKAQSFYLDDIFTEVVNGLESVENDTSES